MSKINKVAFIKRVIVKGGGNLAQLLIEKDYEVNVLKRLFIPFNISRIDHLYQDPHESNANFIFHYGDLLIVRI